MGVADALSDASNFLQSQDTGGYSVSPPSTRTAMSHAITIRSDRGHKIGRIQSWAPAMTRVVDTVFEVHKNNTGEPVERVAQIQNTNRISVERYELYTFHIGEAFGVPTVGNGDPASSGSSNAIDMVSLVRQVKPFSVREIWRDPYGAIRAYIYVGCLFSDWGITIASNDDRIIKARAILEFTRRLRLN
ncbi:hypothetical protein KAR91_60095 [Candidatus Pacearchaeota archaeon]|nr:hypothetical protein [Candidatus Pacearchaeota archaeon]